ncbi:hypothetical protein [Dapis sp. BLCC M229]
MLRIVRAIKIFLEDVHLTKKIISDLKHGIKSIPIRLLTPDIMSGSIVCV